MKPSEMIYRERTRRGSSMQRRITTRIKEREARRLEERRARRQAKLAKKIREQNSRK